MRLPPMRPPYHPPTLALEESTASRVSSYPADLPVESAQVCVPHSQIGRATAEARSPLAAERKFLTQHANLGAAFMEHEVAMGLLDLMNRKTTDTGGLPVELLKFSLFLRRKRRSDAHGALQRCV